MAIAALPDNRFQILSAVSLSSTASYSDGLDCEKFSQMVLEMYPGTFVGTLEVLIEFSETSEFGPWMPDTLEDTSNGTLVVNEFKVPVRRFTRTWSESGNPFQIPIPLAYRYVRVGLKATSGTATAVAKLTTLRGS